MSWEVPSGGSGSLGFTCTGLGWDGTNLIIGDYTNGRIAKTTLAGAYVSEIVLDSPPANSVQGVAWDTSRSEYWVCHYAAAGSGTIRRYDAAGALQDTITTVASIAGPNGLAYDAVNDRLLVCHDDGKMRGYDATAGTLVEGPITLGSFGTADGIAIDPDDPTLIWVSADTDPCTVAKITRSTGAVVSSWKAPKSVEGVTFVGGVFYMAIDQGFHDTVTNGNRVWKFDHLTGKEITGQGVSVKSISFDMATSSSTQLVTGVGFAPAAMIFINSGAPTGLSTLILSYGVADHQNNQWSTAQRNNDAVGTTANDKNFRSGKVLLTTSGAGAEGATVALASVTHDGLILTVSNAGGFARRVHVLCLGGDAVKAQAGVFALTSGAGAQAVTGLYFTPKAELFSHVVPNTTDGPATGMYNSLGAAASAASRWVTCMTGANGVSTSDEQSAAILTQCIVRISAALAFTALVDFTSQDASGFTVTKGTPPGVDVNVGYLALGGTSQYAVGSFNQPVATGTQAVTGLGFTPSAELFVSDMKVSSASVTEHSRLGMGFAVSSSDRRSVAGTALDAVATTDTARDVSEAASILAISDGGTPTRLALADLVSQDADGFTLNWTTADSTARLMLYLAIGAAAVSGVSAAGRTRSRGR